MPTRPEDRQVRREIARYRALRQVGWLDDVCEGCKRKLWNRAGGDDAQGDAGLPAGFLDVLAAIASEGRVLAEIADRKTLNEGDRARLRLIASRLVRALRLFDGRRP